MSRIDYTNQRYPITRAAIIHVRNVNVFDSCQTHLICLRRSWNSHHERVSKQRNSLKTIILATVNRSLEGMPGFISIGLQQKHCRSHVTRY